jgi:bifunctional NMN adenylyltransferase/nudix hydrolase
MKYDLSVYIGRFQPFHLGHKAVIDQALSNSKRVVIIIGSADCARSGKNPWSAEDRVEMIRECYSPEDQRRLVFIPQIDHRYNFDKWLAEVTASVHATAFAKWQADPHKIAIIGVEKDHTSFYLKHFPHWEKIEFFPERMINATDVRRDFFDVNIDAPLADRLDVCPMPVRDWLLSWMNTNALLYHNIADEWQFVEEYKKTWATAPFAPTFVTVDAVVTQSAHVLLITRKSRPGMGMLALPGGFIDMHETLKQSCIRELKEETRIKVPISVLEGSIVAEKTFDDPNRSERGRTITTAFHFKLNEPGLPKVRGSDDAATARWVPFQDLRRNQLYEDHYDILTTMLGI